MFVRSIARGSAHTYNLSFHSFFFLGGGGVPRGGGVQRGGGGGIQGGRGGFFDGERW